MMRPPLDKLMETVEAMEAAANADARAAALRDGCGDDSDLRMLAEALFQEAQYDLVPNAPEFSELGSSFTDIRFVGSGGLGIVYSAQDNVFNRKVAIKIPRSPAHHALFAAETTSQGALTHPGIARVYSRGHCTYDGQTLPYICMELVEGYDLEILIRVHALRLDEKIRVLEQVCSAVSYAHAMRILHCDLKPSNIMLTPDGQTKVLDFGLARELPPGREEIDDSEGGTPAYMSKEQRRGQVTVRSDVYSIGVIAYELLSEKHPYEHLSDPKTQVGGYAQERRVRLFPRLGKLQAWWAGDLEAIVAKAMHADPSQRYAGPEELGEDLRRYRTNHPVIARQPCSLSYTASKFVIRYRLLVIANALVLLALLLGSAVAAHGWRNERAAREEAEQLRRDAEMARQESDGLRSKEHAAREESEFARKETEQMLHFVIEEFIAPASPAIGREPGMSLKDAIIEAASALDTSALADGPKASLRLHLGKSLLDLDELDVAFDLLSEAYEASAERIGPTSPTALRAHLFLGQVLIERGRIADAEPVVRETVRLFEQECGATHPDTLDALSDLAEVLREKRELVESIALHERVLELRQAQLGPRDADVQNSLSNLGTAWLDAGNSRKARPYLEQAVALGEELAGREGFITMHAKHGLAACYCNLGLLEDAWYLARDVLSVRVRVLGFAHSSTWVSYNLSAAIEYRLQWYEDALDKWLALLTFMGSEQPRHPNVGLLHQSIGRTYEAMGDYCSAHVHFSAAYDILCDVFGPEDKRVLRLASFLAGAEHEMHLRAAATRP